MGAKAADMLGLLATDRMGLLLQEIAGSDAAMPTEPPGKAKDASGVLTRASSKQHKK